MAAKRNPGGQALAAGAGSVEPVGVVGAADEAGTGAAAGAPLVVASAAGALSFVAGSGGRRAHDETTSMAASKPATRTLSPGLERKIRRLGLGTPRTLAPCSAA